jgi:hypothetical protein
MASRTIKPDRVKTLKDWAKNYGRRTNLSFDEETREPAIFSADEARTRVGTIPWKREGDTMTILSMPHRFSTQAVEAARSRYGRIVDQRRELQKTTDEQIRQLEAALLEAWRTYDSAPRADQRVLRRDIAAAEKSLREAEAARAAPDRAIRTMAVVGAVELDTKPFPEIFYGAYVPPMPAERRGIPISAAAATAEES